jgi:hypothetical protein
MKHKNRLLVAGVILIVLVLMVFMGTKYNLFTRSEGTQQSSDLNTEGLTSEATQAEDEKAEQERLAKEIEEQARIEAEKQEAERIKALTIETNTKYVLSNDVPIYQSYDNQTDVVGTLDKRVKVFIAAYYVETASSETTTGQSNQVVKKIPASETEPTTLDQVTWVEIKSSYEAKNALGIVKYDELANSLAAFISKPYENVDYKPFEKNVFYEDNPPVEAKGVYVTGNSATTSKLDALIELADTSEINTFVIDVKDDNGYLLFESETASRLNPEANKHIYIDDIEGFVSRLKEHNIYLIARIVTFKSPLYARANPDKAIVYRSGGGLYSDADGLIWASAHNRELWEYNVGVAKEAAAIGFNEIQFDYVRFPAISHKEKYDFRNPEGESQVETIQKFLKYAYGELAPEHVYVGADVFGWAATAIGDVGIGQHWESLSNVVDYICPMVYPSHYGPNIFGLAVPDANPYKTIYHAIEDSKARNANLETPALIRPWIQDFTASWVNGHISYGPEELALQIKALEEQGIESYMIWNSKNNYSEDALR